MSTCVDETKAKVSNWQRIAESLLNQAGIEINGSRPFDIQIHNTDFYKRVLQKGLSVLARVIWTAGGTVSA